MFAFVGFGSRYSCSAAFRVFGSLCKMELDTEAPVPDVNEPLLDAADEKYFIEADESDGETRTYYEHAHCPLQEECKGAKGLASHFSTTMWRCKSFNSPMHSTHYLARHYMLCGHHLMDKAQAVEKAVAAIEAIKDGLETSADRKQYRDHVVSAASARPKSPTRPKGKDGSGKSGGKGGCKDGGCKDGGGKGGKTAKSKGGHRAQRSRSRSPRRSRSRSARRSRSRRQRSTRAAVGERQLRPIGDAPPRRLQATAKATPPMDLNIGGNVLQNLGSSDSASSTVTLRKSQLDFLKDTVDRAAGACESAGQACEQLRAIFDTNKRALKQGGDYIQKLLDGRQVE